VHGAGAARGSTDHDRRRARSAELKRVPRSFGVTGRARDAFTRGRPSASIHSSMLHVIPAHQGRPSDDPIFALNREASTRKARGEAVVNATIGSLLQDDTRLAILPTAARVVSEVPPEEWAAYAPIAGSPDFLNAVIADLFRNEPDLKECA